MIRSDATVLTENGVCRVKDLRPGERLLNPISGQCTVLKQALFRTIEADSPLLNSLYRISERSIHRRAPDQDLVATGSQMLLISDDKRRIASIPFESLGSKIAVAPEEEVELCLLVLEEPSLFVANGVILESAPLPRDTARSAGAHRVLKAG